MSDGKSLLVLVRSLECLPGVLRRHVTNYAIQSEETVGFAISSEMSLGLANTAELGCLVGTVGLAVTWLSTATALAGELTLDSLVSAVRGVMPRLVAVVAEARVGALLSRLWAVTREVTLSAAASRARVSRVRCVRIRIAGSQLTCGIHRHLRRAWRRSDLGSQNPRLRRQRLEEPRRPR